MSAYELGLLVVGLAGTVFVIVLMTQHWFWMLALSIAGFTSFVSMFVSLISLQIWWALGFLLLTCLCSLGFCLAADYRYIMSRLHAREPQTQNDFSCQY